jgi:alkylation response protein AidB-like acyl-CoA dehydrogenase
VDFRPSEEQVALCGLAREILAKEATPERLRASERSPEWLDRELWARLADANLLGVAVPEAQGGIGMGFFELCALFVELGRAVAPLPALPTLAMGGLAIARFGSEAQRDRWLVPLVRGELVLSAALESGPALRARGERGDCVLEGSRACVPALHLAERVLVPARGESGTRVFLVDPTAPGVSTLRQTTSRGEPLFALELAGVRVAADEVLDGPGIEAWMSERARVALAATQLGVSERALEITTRHLREREQFGAPLGALQAVQHRCADCFIDLECLRGVVWKAAYELAQDRPAAREAWIAKFWAAEAGSRIATATQHLHGGTGADVDYPIHRHFLWSKSLELALGAALPQLVELGRDMARTGPEART